jgi:hypothetical protein
MWGSDQRTAIRNQLFRHIGFRHFTLASAPELTLPNLTEHLVQTLNVTTAQAEGGAGLLICMAQHKLNRAEFQQVAETIPAISDIMAKAPRYEARITGPAWSAISRVCGGPGGLTFLVGAFSLLNLDKTMLPKFVDQILSYFNQEGGIEVEALLRAVLR